MDLRNIGDYLEGKLKSKEPFDLYYVRINKQGELISFRSTFVMDSRYGYPFLRMTDNKLAKEKCFEPIRLHNKKTFMGVSRELDTTTRSIGKTKQEAINGLIQSMELKINRKKEDVAKANDFIERAQKTLDMVKKLKHGD